METENLELGLSCLTWDETRDRRVWDTISKFGRKEERDHSPVGLGWIQPPWVRAVPGSSLASRRVTGANDVGS